MASEQLAAPDLGWAGTTDHFISAWQQTTPITQICALIAVVIIALLLSGKMDGIKARIFGTDRDSMTDIAARSQENATEIGESAIKSLVDVLSHNATESAAIYEAQNKIMESLAQQHAKDRETAESRHREEREALEVKRRLEADEMLKFMKSLADNMQMIQGQMAVQSARQAQSPDCQSCERPAAARAKSARQKTSATQGA